MYRLTIATMLVLAIAVGGYTQTSSHDAQFLSFLW